MLEFGGRRVQVCKLEGMCFSIMVVDGAFFPFSILLPGCKAVVFLVGVALSCSVAGQKIGTSDKWTQTGVLCSLICQVWSGEFLRFLSTFESVSNYDVGLMIVNYELMVLSCKGCCRVPLVAHECTTIGQGWRKDASGRLST